MRLARADDVAELVRLEEELFGVDAWSRELVLAELTGPGRWFVVTDDLSGYAVVWCSGEVADLLRIGVRPDARRRGLASALLRDVVERAGAQRVMLEVSARNEAALAFYESWGFRRLHLRPRYYRDGSDAVVLMGSADHRR